MSKINNNLFLGSYQDARNQVFLKRNNITHIVTVGAELKVLYPKNYKYLYIEAYDMPHFRLIKHFDKIADFIHNAIETEQGNVFVHCYAGISRSSSSIIAYLIKHKGMPFIQAKDFVKSKRSIVWPNPGFVRQLMDFEKKIATGGGTEPDMKSTATSSMRNSSFMGLGSIRSFKPKETRSGSTANISKDVSQLESQRKEETKMEEEKKADDSKFDYSCRKCGTKLFTSQQIVHNTGRIFNAHCNAIYIEPTIWMENKRIGFSKIHCPNVKCGDILGFKTLKGGKCGCNKEMTNMCGIYPLRITYVKLKA